MSIRMDNQVLNAIDTKGCLSFPLSLPEGTVLENTPSGTKVKKLAADNGRKICSDKIEEEVRKTAAEKAVAEKVAAEKAAAEKAAAEKAAAEKAAAEKAAAEKAAAEKAAAEKVAVEKAAVEKAAVEKAAAEKAAAERAAAEKAAAEKAAAENAAAEKAASEKAAVEKAAAENAAAEKVAAEKAASEKAAVENKEELIAFTKSHFRRIAGSLMQEDFEGRYFNNNTPLHVIFSLNEEVQSLSAIKKLQELLDGGKIASGGLRNIFEAENDDSITPIEVLLANPVQTIGAIVLTIKNLEFLKILLNAGSKSGTICEIAGKRLYVENQTIFEGIATQTAAHALIINKCLDKFVENFMAKIMSELNVALYKHTKVGIKTKISELYKLVQNNDILKAKFLGLLNIESINHVVTDVYSRDVIKGKLKFIEQTERLRIDALLEHEINKFNIELSFNRIANLNTTLYKSGLVDNNFGYTVVRSIKAKLNIVLNKAIQLIKAANEEQLKNIYEVALKTIKPYEPIYIKRGFDDLEQHLKNAVDNRVLDFIQGVCKAQENYHNHQEASKCLDKLYAFKQQYSFLRNDLCSVQKAAGTRYIELSIQDINGGKNLFSDFTCKEKTNAISVPLAITGAVSLYISGAGIAGAALASGMFLLGLDVNKEIDASHSIVIGSSIVAAITGLSYLEHGLFCVSKAAAIGSIIGGTLTGLGEVVGTVIDKALDCE